MKHYDNVRVNERIINISIFPYKIRVWVSVDDAWLPSENDSMSLIKDCISEKMDSLKEENDHRILIAEEIAKLKITNAVEVLDYNLGNGVLIYPSWP